jgi:hypothetical protein
MFEIEGAWPNVTSLDCEPTTETDELTKEAWEESLRELSKRQTNLNWEIGDALLKGTKFYPEESPGGETIAGYWVPGGPDVYSVASFITGLSRGHLQDLASTARRCIPSVRTVAVSWSHHRALVNALPEAPDDELKSWLDRAAKQGWSVQCFSDQLKPESSFTPATLTKKFTIEVPIRGWETLRDLAGGNRSKIRTVAAKLLVDMLDDETMQQQRKITKQHTDERRRERRRRVGHRVARTYDPLGLQR